MGTNAKLFLGLPIYGNPNALFFAAFTGFWGSSDLSIAPLHPRFGDSLIPRSRNVITRWFLESDATHLLFVDSDLGFQEKDVKRLLSHNLDVVGGLYCHKDMRSPKPRFVLNGLGAEFKPDANGLVEVASVGTGFMLISRRVFEIVLQHIGKDIWYTDDDDHKTVEHNFWPVGVYTYPDGHRRYLSEDWYFCQRWRDLGGKVYADTNVLLEHEGRAIYPLRSQVEEFLRSARQGSFDAPPGVALTPPHGQPAPGELIHT